MTDARARSMRFSRVHDDFATPTTGQSSLPRRTIAWSAGKIFLYARSPLAPKNTRASERGFVTFNSQGHIACHVRHDWMMNETRARTFESLRNTGGRSHRHFSGVHGEYVIDQRLRVDFVEERDGPRLLDWMRSLQSWLHRLTEHGDGRELNAKTTRRLDAVHPGHRDVHQNQIGLERMRLSDRLEPVRGLADDLQLGPRLHHLAKRRSHRRVIVDDQQLQYTRRKRAPDRRGPADVRGGAEGRPPGRRVASRHDESESRSLARRAVDFEPAPQHHLAFADA